MKVTIEQTLDQAGAGPFQRNLLGVFGLVWAADAMQVLAVGFTAASIAATFSLTVPQALQTGTLFFFGILIGAALFGRLADKYGRRRVLLITVACDAVFGLLSAFSPNFAILLGLRFLTGIAVGGTLPVDYAMMAEFLPSKNRGRWLVMLEGFWAVGTVIIALAAWAASLAGVADAWRYIFVVTAAPALIGIWLRIWIPESPMHLLKTGQTQEAKSVMNRVLRRNGKPELPPKAVLDAPLLVTNEKLLSPNLRQRTLTTLAIWFLVSVFYYGIFTWIPAKLASDGFGFVRGYGFLVVVALAQLPGYALAAYGVEAWGRRKTLIGFLFISAAACRAFHCRWKLCPGWCIDPHHELRSARHMGRALCVYAGALSDSIACKRHGRGRRYGAPWRIACTFGFGDCRHTELQYGCCNVCRLAGACGNNRLLHQCGNTRQGA